MIFGLALVGAPSIASAQATLYWDINGNTAGLGGTGTWNTANTFWNTDATGAGGGTVSVWTNGTFDDAVFGGTAGTVTVSGTIDVQNITFNSVNYTLTGGTLNLGGTTPTISASGNSDTIASVLAGTSGFTKTGAGGVLLAGANTYTGTTTISAGTLALGTVGGTTGSLGTGAVINNGTLRFNRSNTHTVSNDISGTGGLTSGGTGTTILTGTNTYTGGTTITSGTIQVGNGGATGTLGTGGVGTVAGSSLIFNRSGTLTVSGTLSGSGTLTLAGPGTIVMTGSSALTGGYFLNAGTLQVASSVNLGGSGTLTFNGGTLKNTGSFTSVRPVTLTGMGTFETAADLSLTGVVSGAGSLIKTGSATLTLRGANTYGGTTTISAGTLQVGNGGTTGTLGTGAVINNANLTFNRSNTLSVANTIGGTGSVTKAGAGTTSLTASNTYTGATIINAGTLQAGAAAGGQAFGLNSAVTLANVAGATLDLNGFGQTIGSLAGGGTAGGNVTLGSATLTTGGNNTSTDYGGVISGTGGLIKTGSGVQTLSGANTYTGGTTIGAGTLQLGNGGTSGSISGNVLNNGVLAFNRSDAMTFGGVISGSGALQQIGSGLTNLTANSPGFTGTASVSGGTLAVNGDLSACAAMNVLSGGRLQGTGTVCDTTNFAGGTIAPGNSIGTITIAGNYAGVGGLLEVEAILGTDASPTDLLHVTGNTSGPTNVRVINLGGTGGATVEGIRIVQVDGASAGSFTLLGDYVFNGEQAVVGGAYAYRLYQGSTSAPGDGDWYLRSALVLAPGLLFQAGVPIYESYPHVLQTFVALDTMRQRLGNRARYGDVGVVEFDTAAEDGFWWRVEGNQFDASPQLSTSSTSYGVTTGRVQVGIDMTLSATEAGKLVAGILVQYGMAAADVRSFFGDGTITSTGFGVGGTLTFQGIGGFYLDGQGLIMATSSTLSSSLAAVNLASASGGSGFGLSLEAGQKVVLSETFSITPQVQIAYSSVTFNEFNDAFGAPVALTDADRLRGRLGLSADYETEWQSADGAHNTTHVYGVANVYYDFLGGSEVRVAGTPFVSQNDPLSGGIGIGGSLSLNDDAVSLHGEALVTSSLANLGANPGFSATGGLRVRW